MGIERLENANPVLYDSKPRRTFNTSSNELDLDFEEPIDAEEVFEYIRDITDPEHPYTLEQLNVVQEDHIKVCNGDDQYVDVRFTPTIPHCSMATLIGLAIHVKLRRSLPVGYKIKVRINSGTHNQEEQINRQLADKERVAAAMENSNLMKTINGCLRPRE